MKNFFVHLHDPALSEHPLRNAMKSAQPLQVHFRKQQRYAKPLEEERIYDE